MSFGEHCWVNFAVTFAATTQAITVGDRVHIGPNAVITHGLYGCVPARRIRDLDGDR